MEDGEAVRAPRGVVVVDVASDTEAADDEADFLPLRTRVVNKDVAEGEVFCAAGNAVAQTACCG